MNNLFNSPEKLKDLPLSPSLIQPESVISASNTVTKIIKESTVLLYRKALDSYIPNMLANWYTNSYQSLIEVIFAWMVDGILEI